MGSTLHHDVQAMGSHATRILIIRAGGRAGARQVLVEAVQPGLPGPRPLGGKGSLF